MYGEHCLSRQAVHNWPVKTSSFGRTLSWQSWGWKSSARVVPTATKRIFRCRFPVTCETVGQVFKSVWRICWKINVVCMSLSPFDSFQSRFVTYLLNFPRIRPWLHQTTSVRLWVCAPCSVSFLGPRVFHLLLVSTSWRRVFISEFSCVLKLIYLR